MKLTKISKHKETKSYQIFKINYTNFFGIKKEKLIIKERDSPFSRFLDSGSLIDIGVYRTVLSFSESDVLYWDIH